MSRIFGALLALGIALGAVVVGSHALRTTQATIASPAEASVAGVIYELHIKHGKDLPTAHYVDYSLIFN
jgi:hypothetical protein